MKIGFVGTGGIAEAMIVGLVSNSGYSEPIWVTRRSELRSSRLQEQFSNVIVVDDNQQLIDKVDTVFISVLPKQAPSVLSDLRFRSEHLVASLVAGLSLNRLQELCHPVESICRIIPMPTTEIACGPIVVAPTDSAVVELLSRIGNIIETNDEACFSAFSASSAVMATFFEWIATQARWLEAQGVSRDEAAAYSSNLLHGLSALAANVDVDSLQQLSEECLTTGGLNEQVLRHCQKSGWFAEIEGQLDKILERIS